MEFLYEYGLFFAKTLTFVVAIAVLVGIIASASLRGRSSSTGHIEVTKLNEKYDEIVDGIKNVVLDEAQLKSFHQDQKKKDKEEKKRIKASLKQNKKRSKESDASEPQSDRVRRVFVTDFDGDIKASDTENLRKVISAILSLAQDADEVVVRLESQGGMVHSYGLAASQLSRIKDKGIPLTICIDKVAASGGYMMACVANKIISAPFAILGSIGVVAQLPNFHRLLRKNNIDFELLTAGEHKRTLTMFGENTDKGRKKFIEDLEDTHVLFKDFIRANRESVDIDDVATGEIWFGTRALDKRLVDEIKTSDQYLLEACAESDVYEISYKEKKSLAEKLGIGVESAAERVFTSLLQKLNNKFYS